jgi:hypothetical protein
MTHKSFNHTPACIMLLCVAFHFQHQSTLEHLLQATVGKIFCSRSQSPYHVVMAYCLWMYEASETNLQYHVCVVKLKVASAVTSVLIASCVGECTSDIFISLAIPSHACALASFIKSITRILLVSNMYGVSVLQLLICALYKFRVFFQSSR